MAATLAQATSVSVEMERGEEEVTLYLTRTDTTVQWTMTVDDAKCLASTILTLFDVDISHELNPAPIDPTSHT